MSRPSTEPLGFEPLPGAQTLALSVDADWVLYGGRAGVGKTAALALYPFHFLARGLPAKGKLIRLWPRHIRQPGTGTFDAMRKYWEPYGAHARRGTYCDFTWWMGRDALSISCHGLDVVGKERDFHGGEIDFYEIDELGEFWAPEREAQIFWLGSRARSGMRVGFRPQMFATLNPCLGWIRQIVDWYIGQDGQPIWSRSGEVRWLVRRWHENLNGQKERTFHFADTRAELVEAFPGEDPISYTLVSARREDNPYTDWEDYERRLKNLDPHERERLLDGNWNARPVDPARIYHPGPGVIVRPESQAWGEIVREAAVRGIRHRGGWDYGRDRALAWVGGVVVPGSPPCLWITEALLFPDCDAPEAAAIRLTEDGARRGIYYTDSADFGDPAGRARDSGQGWAATLEEHGVDLEPLAHSYGEDGEWYWNSAAGRVQIRTLVKSWMRSGRLRILADVSLVVSGMEAWRRKVPMGVDPLDVDAEHVPPEKSRASHVMDALGYLVAGVAEELKIEAAEAHEPVIDVSASLDQRRLILERPTGF